VGDDGDVIDAASQESSYIAGERIGVTRGRPMP
jgi:hypothetical protein